MGVRYGVTRPRPIDEWLSLWNNSVRIRTQEMSEDTLYPNLETPLASELNLSFTLHDILSNSGKTLLNFQPKGIIFARILRHIVDTNICLLLVDCCLNSQEVRILTTIQSSLKPSMLYEVELSENVRNFLEDLQLTSPFRVEDIVRNVLNLVTSLRPDIISLPYFLIRVRTEPEACQDLTNINFELLNLSLQYYAKYYKSQNTFEPMPVIQICRDYALRMKNYLTDILNRYASTLTQICSSYNVDIRWIGYGAHLPFGGDIRRYLMLDLRSLELLRTIFEPLQTEEIISDFILHVFGIGSPTTVSLFSTICDSTECHAWEFVGGQGQIFPLPFKDVSSQRQIFRKYGAFRTGVPNCDFDSLGYWVILSQAYLQHSRGCRPRSSELERWRRVRPILEDDFIEYMYDHCYCPYCYEAKQRNIGIDVYARELCPSRHGIYSPQTYNDCRRIHNAWVLYEISWIIRYYCEDDLRKFYQAILCFLGLTSQIQLEH